MILKQLKPRKALNKAFLKVKPNRIGIERFKTNLIQLLDRINDSESEEFHKNLIIDFLKKTYYDPNHFINTKDRNDLVIHNGEKPKSSVGVILEVKKTTNKSEMVTTENLNVKAFHELVLYYLRERITQKNLEVKHLVITNINEWFVFDAITFDRLFAQNKNFVKQFVDFEAGRLSDTTTDFFYTQIANPFIAGNPSEIEFTYFNIQDFQQSLRNTDKADDNLLIALFKLLSPEHLLKLPFTNDSNSLDKRFYSELLHIIGLTETKEGSKKLIGRNKEGERHTGTILEDAIIQLDSLDKLSRLEKPSQFGNTQQERLFNVALELSITWINRILFLKLLESQLITYHRFDKSATSKSDKSYSFLNLDKIKSFDALNTLFFQVLARKYNERNEDVKKAFEQVPYLNSSLFEPTDLEHATLFISNLRNDKSIPVFSQTVLKDEQGKKITGSLNTLEYLFAFLDAYDFSSEGSEEIQEENKTLINASVLGLIFEKINGYKDGSFFTPGFITMYMSRETIRKAVVQKFNEIKKWNCTNLDELYDKIEDRKEANEIVNSIKICDPAVGSGHFLVSVLNEMIAVKNDLKILQDRDGRRLKEYQVEVVNDELIVTDEEGELFEYNPNSKESQRIQETLFHEKQAIIENCLFGVDINSNSVKICRLRLWIELLKNAYYIQSSSPKLGEVSEGRRGREDLNALLSERQWGQERLNNLPHLKTFRRELRKQLTPAEAKLWTLLKGKQMEGRKFRRQHSIANYILDFYCPEERLAIELDGQGHFGATQADYDRERDLFLEYYGIRVLRFENKWVWDNPEGLLETIKGYFGKQPPRFKDSFSLKGECFDNQPPRPSDTPPLKGGERRELQTLPNIDINIKCGNSLISRFAIDADLKQALRKSKWTIDSYRVAVATYRNAESKEQKRKMEQLINEIKTNFRSEISQNDPKVKRLHKLSGELFILTNQGQLFELTEKEKDDWNAKATRLTTEIQKLESEIEEIKANKIFENAFEWRFEFPEVLNDDGDFVGFDVVIGNPPYIRQEEIKELKRYLQDNYSTFNSTADLYVYFVERGINILTNNGNFIFILPNKWFKAGYGNKIREWIKSFQICSIVDFGDLPVFEEATTYPCLLSIKKQKVENNTILVSNVETLSFPDGLDNYLTNRFYSVEQDLLEKTGWALIESENQKVINKIKSNGIYLKDLTDIHIFRGIVTGCNEAFVIDELTKNRLIKEDSNSSKIIKPFLAGKDIKRYQSPRTNKYLIITQRGIEIENYPAVFKHLKKYETQLSKKAGGGKWYELQASPSDTDKFEKTKIMYPDISKDMNFIIDEESHYSVNTVYNISSDSKALLAYLNSKVFHFYYLTISNSIRGGYLRFFTDYMNNCPIPKDLSILEELSIKIIDAKKQNPSADTSALESQIDQLVYQLYDLTEEEIKIVEENTSIH